MLRVHNLRLLITSAVCLAAAILLSQISGITDALRSDQALAAGFHANIISDGIFEDNSAMPRIVINEAALDAFGEITPLKREEALELVGKSGVITGEKEYVCELCGVIDDGEDAPRAYISEVLSQSLFSSQQDDALVYFDGLWSGKAAEKALNATGFSAKSPNTRYDGWKSELSACALTALLGIAIIALSAVYDTLKHKRTCEELRALHSLGVTRAALRTCAVIRWTGLAVLLICAAMGVLSVNICPKLAGLLTNLFLSISVCALHGKNRYARAL